MKTVIVACGAGVATSTILSQKIETLLEENQIVFRLIQCSLNEVTSYLQGSDLIVSSMQIFEELPIPKVLGISFLTGIGEEETKNTILEILKK